MSAGQAIKFMKLKLKVQNFLTSFTFSEAFQWAGLESARLILDPDLKFDTPMLDGLYRPLAVYLQDNTSKRFHSPKVSKPKDSHRKCLRHF